MSYCVNCGVELSQNEKKCPLCGTEVYHPNQKVIKADTEEPPIHNISHLPYNA